MATRVVEGKKLWTGGTAITVDQLNKVISLNLRDENNLIMYDVGDDEIYVDLQLGDEIRPTSDFPVGVTTGRAITDNGWGMTGTILVAKTTSGDNIKLFYCDDGKLYIDNGTGSFTQIYLKPEVDALLKEIRDFLDENLNTKTFYLAGTTGEGNIAIAQAAKDWIDDGRNAVICYNNETYYMINDANSQILFISQLKLNDVSGAVSVDKLILTYNNEDEVTTITTSNYDLNNTFVDLSSNQTIDGTKTFEISPIVPSKTTDALDSGTDLATEAQVYNVASQLDDYSWVEDSGATITIETLRTTLTPSEDFEIEAGNLKEGMFYVLLVTSDLTAYNMSLGTGITNPFNEDLTLTAEETTIVIMLATSDSTLQIVTTKTSMSI